MENKITGFISRNHLFSRDDHLLVAISGGLDSVVLTHILLNLNYRILLAHVNYNLRGEESVKDEEFVKKLAGEHGLKLHLLNCGPPNQKGSSLQEEARSIRYDWLEKIADRHSLSHILTAHHADDSIETVLLNFFRGSGPEGLKGIPHSRGKIRRPLLSCTREEIMNYAKVKGIRWREDQTNRENTYQRNFLRNTILPQVEKHWPGLRKTLLRNAEIQGESHLIVRDWLDREKDKVRKQETENLLLIDLNEVQASLAPVTLLREMLKDTGVQTEVLVEILQSSTAGREWYNADKTIRLLTEPGGILSIEKLTPEGFPVVKIERTDTELKTPFGALILESGREHSGSKSPEVAVLAMEKLRFPLQLRLWKAGDSFCPSGMKGKRKKVKKFLTDLKLGKRKKEKVPVLLSEGDICWVVGHRVDERFAARDSDKRADCIYLRWETTE
ncbi:MAG: tRNA lysidine(34) synthetase TilS [Saprospirales bacterium]|nr:MAG: tRNA lysidine(34) synthetase TilS [Saprospirales bacterium]